MRGRRAVAGIDLGTSGVKVQVVSLNDPAPDARRPALDAKRSAPAAENSAPAAVSPGHLATPDARHPAPDTPDAHLPAPDGGVLGRVLGRGRAEYPVLVPSAGRADPSPPTGGSQPAAPSARPSPRHETPR